MALLAKGTRTVYRAPTARRDYFTPRAAAHNEAAAMLKKKYPSERSHSDDFGRIEDPGYHYTNDPRLVRVHARLTRLLLKQLRRGS